MRDFYSYSTEDLNSVIGQISKEISKLTGRSKDDLLPSSKLSDSLLSSSNRISLEAAFKNRFGIEFQGMLEPPFVPRRRSFFERDLDAPSIEDVAMEILGFQPRAAQIGEAFDARQAPQTLAKKEPNLPVDSKSRIHE